MNIGLDIGRGNVKAITMDKKVKFESYAGKARELDFENKNDKYIIDINGEKYFTGELAKREGMARGFQKNKLDYERTLPLALTGLYLATGSELNNIVIGLPISDYKTQREELESFLKGSYEVAIDQKRVIRINNVKAFPEGAGAYFNLVLNNQGKVVNTELATSKVGIVDIGYKTTNIVVFENMKYIDRLSVSLPYGVHQAFNMIYKRLSRTEDITPEQAENITTGIEFEQLANRIKNEINKFWGNTLFKIYLVGGGSYLLKRYFDFEAISNAEFANAEGYFKIAQMLFPERLVWEI